jgi:biotin carboxyl carrier protein
MKEYKFNINGSDYTVNINEVEGQEISLEVNGTPYKVSVDKELRKQASKTVTAPRPAANVASNAIHTTAPVAKPAAKGNATDTPITTPLPGTILDVFVNVGDAVKTGQKLVNLEAMKMENNIESEVDGVVKSVNVRKGDSVLEGDTLVVVG